MGTRIVAILLEDISTTYSSSWLHEISITVFVLNIILFVSIFGATALRYILYPAVWQLMIEHPLQSLFLGTAPMGFATLVNMFIFVCVPIWGNWAKSVAWALW